MFAIFELRDQRRRLVSRGDTCYQNYILAKKNVNAACPKCHNENVIENRIFEFFVAILKVTFPTGNKNINHQRCNKIYGVRK